MNGRHRHPMVRYYPYYKFPNGLISSNQGFTLIEMILSLALMGILAAIFGMGLVAAMEGHDFSRNNVLVAQKGHLAMARMTRELMELVDIRALDDSGPGQYMVYERIGGTTGQPEVISYGIHHDQGNNTIQFYTGLPDNVTTLPNGDGGDTLTDGVDSFAFQFFQGQDPWTWGSDMRLLSQIRITLRLTRPDDPGHTQDFTTTIHLRNTDNPGGAAL